MVNGLLSPDSVMAVYVHQTVPLDTGAWRAVPGAEVLIYEAGQNEPVRLTHRGGQRTWRLGLYNAYWRLNPYFIYLDYNDAGDLQLYQFSLFPILPSIGYERTF